MPLLSDLVYLVRGLPVAAEWSMEMELQNGQH